MVNVTDMPSQDSYPSNLWAAMQDHQRQLHVKYMPIEIKSGVGYGLVNNIPYSLDHPKWQYYLKDLMWRTTEELMEAEEAEHHDHMEHAAEEMIDALHFLLELTCVIRLPVHDSGMEVQPDHKLISFPSISPIYYLGIAANCLKNKPWKQTHMKTDTAKFYQNVLKAVQCLRASIRSDFNLKDDEIFDLYMKKRQVNEFRIRSRY